MKLQTLLVHKVRLVRLDPVGIQRAVCFIEARVLLLVALSRQLGAAKSIFHNESFLVTTIATFDHSRSALDVGLAGSSNDAWNDNKLSHQVAL